MKAAFLDSFRDTEHFVLGLSKRDIPLLSLSEDNK
jgi:hypothetical protein